MLDVPDTFYRVSVKALVLDTNNRFLLLKQENGKWDFPGGGLEFHEAPKECLEREIGEEMGLRVVEMNDAPSYFFTFLSRNKIWLANVIYLTKLENLEFNPSKECVELNFFDRETAEKENILPNVIKFIKLY